MQVEDPWTSQILKYTEMGFSREEVCMALAALGTDSDRDDKVSVLLSVIVEAYLCTSSDSKKCRPQDLTLTESDTVT